jgi:hypothetical protein
MVAFLDLIGSTIIRGGIVLILLRLTLSMRESGDGAEPLNSDGGSIV